ncbi:MAG: 2-oxo-4-hydroxy-4-carboxy-5-ureidoimidazoline decarboxylase [Puniceicoccaceae bacterium]
MSNGEKLTIGQINHLAAADFLNVFGSVFEFAPWVMDLVAERRPFRSVKGMQATAEAVLFGLDGIRQLELICNHPDLAAKLETLSELSEASRREQQKAGFGQMGDKELDELRAALERYRERFGHPFILCVSEHRAEEVMPILEARLNSSGEEERWACLVQIARIGWHRICTLASDAS